MTRFTFSDDHGHAGWVDDDVHEHAWSENESVITTNGVTIARNIWCARAHGRWFATWDTLGQGVRQEWVDGYRVEGLFRTRSGQWVHVVATDQDSTGAVTSPGFAMAWLARHAPDSDLMRHLGEEPDEVRPAEPRPVGRPALGTDASQSTVRKITMTDTEWARAGELAAALGVSRAEVVRRALAAYTP